MVANQNSEQTSFVRKLSIENDEKIVLMNDLQSLVKEQAKKIEEYKKNRGIQNTKMQELYTENEQMT